MAKKREDTPMQKHFLAVVADEAQAILYTHDTRSGPLSPWQRFENDMAHAKNVDLASDRGGRSFDSHGQGRHSMTSDKTSPREQAATMFAKRIAKEVTADINTGQVRGYALIAAPRFLGELRDALAIATNSEPYASINKDVVDKDPAVIAEMLASAQQ
jgi:protein required for attachment to host cells